ncbi:MAG: TetR/AcrR family transcriptional regulator [Pseudomonadales bacterium]
MSSIRERQKVARREQILEAARKLFMKLGYSKTNMDAIADAAVVGVATIYTYFDSKEGVLAEIYRKDWDEIRLRAEQVLKDLPKNPAESIVALLDTYEQGLDFVSHKFTVDFFIQSKTAGPVRDATNWSHDWQIDQIRTALELGQKAGTVSSALDVNVASMVVLDLHFRHLGRIAGETYTPAVGHRDLEKSIRILFDNWRA